jgi:chromosomal replication initiation ATPase DnaA
MAGYQTSFMPPAQLVVPIERINRSVIEAQKQQAKLTSALAEIELSRKAVMAQMDALAKERRAVDRIEHRLGELRARKTGQFKIAHILEIVSVVSDLSLIEITSERRTGQTVRARQTYFWIARRFTGRSLPEIGRRCGGKDHTTVLHGQKKLDAIVKRIGSPAVDTPEDWARHLLTASWKAEAA